MPPDNDEGRPGKGGPVTIPIKVITDRVAVVANTTCPLACPASCSVWRCPIPLPAAVAIVVESLVVTP